VRRVAAVALLLALIAGCGVRADDRPQQLDAKDVPFDLLAPATNVPEANGEGVGRAVWFVDNNGLLARGERPIKGTVTVEAILKALLNGVTDAEANNGLRSNITAGTKLRGIRGPSQGLVTVDLSGEILTVSREQQRLALAQVVFTVTGLPNVDRVLFEIDGKPTKVPGRGDELTDQPLTRADFAQFDPTATTTTIRP
jgi:hypothetical protein